MRIIIMDVLISKCKLFNASLCPSYGNALQWQCPWPTRLKPVTLLQAGILVINVVGKECDVHIIQSTSIQVARQKLHHKWKEGKKSAEGRPLRKATKVHVYAQCLACLSKPERTYWSLTPHLDTVITEFSYSTKPERYSMETIQGQALICHHEMGPVVTQDLTVSKLAILARRYFTTLAKNENTRFFLKPMLTWVMIKIVDTSVHDHTKLHPDLQLWSLV